MKAGAYDYVVKSTDSFQRLPLLADRAIESRRARLDRDRAESDLRQSEERYRSLVMDSSLGIFTCDPQGRLLDANPKAQSLLEIPDGPLDQGMGLLTHTPLLESGLAAGFRRCLRSGETLVSGGSFNRGTSRQVWLRWHLQPFYSDGALTTVRGMVEDVTREKELEAELLHSQKIEAIGRVAGGIAHDFNNYLTVILGCGALVLDDLGEQHPSHEVVREIVHAGERAAQLTRQLLAFARRERAVPESLDLNQVLRDMRTMLDRLVGEKIEIGMTLAEALPLVRADRSQLEQVILNLTVNARDAMPYGGRLNLETNLVSGLARPSDAGWQVAPGDYVCLRAKDTGCGMTAEVMQHLFEPFFTTKERGMGTGLGLATIHGIVKQSGGDIRAESEPGRGTVFSILLPVAADASREAETDGPTPVEREGGETILVVEDEPEVLSLACHILRRAGYNVLAARDGVEALDLLQSANPRPGLVFTDVMMPGLGGPEMAELARGDYPSLPVLFTSGHASRVSPGVERWKGGEAILPKPYTPTALLHAIRELLRSYPEKDSDPAAPVAPGQRDRGSD